jgi:DNA polymerase-4
MTVLHVDLDAFFASVEQLLDPALAGKPVVVGGLGRRGVVCAASYEARPFGVHSAMPMAIARRRCPDAVFLPVRHEVYERFSREVMDVLASITPLVEQLSIDEAFLDVHGVRRLHGDAVSVATVVRRRVKDEVGLAASVGAASTKFLAKIASDLAKPDGLLVVAEGHERELLHPLPVQRLWGVGPKTLARLERLGVRTVGDVARLPVDALVAAVGDAHGRHLHALAHNQDERAIVTERDTKSIGNEETFAYDLTTVEAAARELTRLADRVAARLRHAGVEARTINLKARYGDFTTLTRARTLRTPTALSTVIAATARELLANVDVARGVRLLGVSGSQLVAPSEAQQGTLELGSAESSTDGHGTDDRGGDDRRAAVERTVDEVRARFGAAAIAPATLLERDQPSR